MSSPLAQPLDRLPDPLPIPPLAAPFRAVITPPGSKSLTNRALLLAALADGASELRRPLIDADDAEVMIGALADLGAATSREQDVLQVGGCGGRWRPAPHEVTLGLRNAGTATRFLAAASLFSPVPVVIDGNGRMRQRPIGELIDALRSLGATCAYLGRNGCPPVRITPPSALPRSPTLHLATTLSSQVISALLLAAPWIPGGLTLKHDGEITSRSYVAMTLGLLEHLGATVKATEDLRTIRVGPAAGRGAGVAPFTLAIEPDASGASYFWAAAALVPGASCTVPGLGDRSLQGDARFPELLARMGAEVRADAAGTTVTGGAALGPVTADLADMPDAAMTLAALACFAPGRSVLRGLRTLRVKETDRIEAMRVELGRVGVRVETGLLGDPGAIAITPPQGGLPCGSGLPPVSFATYDDHRMAMSLALIGLRRPGVLIRDPGCVSKTYPAFWRDLDSLRGA